MIAHHIWAILCLTCAWCAVIPSHGNNAEALAFEEDETQCHRGSKKKQGRSLLQIARTQSTLKSSSDPRDESFRWIISFRNCTDEDLDSLKVHMPKGSAFDFKGHPDEGGLCTFMMSGTEEQLLEELRTHKLPSE